MKMKLLACASLIGLHCAAGFAGPTKYSYEGTPYTLIMEDINAPVAGSFTSEMRISGYFTVREALAPNKNFDFEVPPRSKDLTFYFTDGRFEYTPRFIDAFYIRGRTNATGSIASWDIYLERVAPFAFVGRIETDNDCRLFRGSACDLTVYSTYPGATDLAAADLTGAWTVTAVPVVPEPFIYSTLIAGLALVALAVRRRTSMPSPMPIRGIMRRLQHSLFN